jgi:1-acyl-sn-glycerol-3-phosphate acyltransferase
VRTLVVRSLVACLRPVARGLLKARYGLRVHGAQHVPRQGGVVFAANHASFLDPVILDVACPRRVVFLAREALFQIPWLGLIMRGMGTLPIDRQETETGIRRAIQLLRAGRAIMIFPEGGRQISGELGQARPGVGFLAGSAHVPIVPVYLSGTREALPPGARGLKPAKIEVAFGPEIRYPNTRLSPEICERLAQQVTTGWQQLRDSLNTQHTHGDGIR